MIYLRELSRADIPTINCWRNDEKLLGSLLSPFRYVDREIDMNWFEKYQERRNTEVRCSICLRESAEIIGTVSVTSIDHIHRCADFHVMIGNTDYQGRGLGSIASQLMLRHAFNDRNLHRISAFVLEDNIRAMSCYEKLGFIKEGVMRQAVYKQGFYKNVVIMGLINPALKMVVGK